MRKKTTEEFINKSKSIHGDRYDYSMTNYSTARTMVTIICPKHGEFKQLPNNHYRCGCNKCGCEITSFKNSSSAEEFIKKAKKIHGNKYDYTKVKYIKNSKKVIIICPIHGDFLQTPNNHLCGFECIRCGDKKTLEKQTLTLEEVLDKFYNTHKKRYDYSVVNYINMHSKVTIKCKEHGEFHMTPLNHIHGQNCPLCSNPMVSLVEKNFQIFIKSLGKEVEFNNREILKPKELDVYFPELNKAIEFNGKYWHYHKDYFIPGKHAEKSSLCREKGINLLYVREDLWKKDRIRMEQVIKKFLT